MSQLEGKGFDFNAVRHSPTMISVEAGEISLCIFQVWMVELNDFNIFIKILTTLQDSLFVSHSKALSFE